MATRTVVRTRLEWRWARLHVLRGLAVFALVVAVASNHGGYFPGPWGWAILAAAWAAALALLSRGAMIARPALITFGFLVAFLVWTGLSAFWSLSPTQSALETQRVGVYAATFLAVAVWVRRSPLVLLVGVWAGVVAVCGYSVLTRLVPDRFGVDYIKAGNRLAAPVGYWNSLGLFAAGGLILAVGLAAEGGNRWLRGLAAASTPTLVLTIYFTYSRGAWLSLAVGAVVYVALSVRTARLLVVVGAVVPWCALAAWRASTSRPLTVGQPVLAQAAHAGHRVLALGLVLSVLAGASVVGVTFVDRALKPSARARQALRVALAAIVVLALVAGFVRYGSPVTVTRHAWDKFNAAPPSTKGTTLNHRLFSLSSTGRVRQWRIAWRQAKAHPIVGTGARTYENYWNRERPSKAHIRDVHNLYLQVLAELGVVGLVLLSGVLVVPLVTAVRSRRRPLVAAGAGLCVAYLAHAIVDWDWEITGVMLPFVVVAAVIASPSPGRIPRRVRHAGIAVAVLFAVGGAYTIAARLPLNRLNEAITKQQWARAQQQAYDASRLAPWSSEPWLALGEGEIDAGLFPQAQAALLKATAADPNNWVAWWDLARATRGGLRQDALLHLAELNPLARQPPAPGSD